MRRVAQHGGGCVRRRTSRAVAPVALSAAWPCAWRVRHASAAALCASMRALHASPSEANEHNDVDDRTSTTTTTTTTERARPSRFAHRNSSSSNVTASSSSTTTCVATPPSPRPQPYDSRSGGGGGERDGHTTIAAARTLREVHSVLYKNYVTLQKHARVLQSFSTLAAAALVEGDLLRTLACEGAAQSSAAACRRRCHRRRHAGAPASQDDDNDDAAAATRSSSENEDGDGDEDECDVIIDVSSSPSSSRATVTDVRGSHGSGGDVVVRLPRRAMQWLRAGIVVPPPPSHALLSHTLTRDTSAHNDDDVEVAWAQAWRLRRRSAAAHTPQRKQSDNDDDDDDVCVFPTTLLRQLQQHFGFATTTTTTTARSNSNGGTTRYAAAVIAAATTTTTTSSSSSSHRRAQRAMASNSDDDNDDDDAASATHEAVQLLRSVELFKWAKDERLLLQPHDTPSTAAAAAVAADTDDNARTTHAPSFVAQLQALRMTVRRACAATTSGDATALSSHVHTLHAQSQRLCARLPRVDDFVRVPRISDSRRSNNNDGNSDAANTTTSDDVVAHARRRDAYVVHAIDLLFHVLFRFVLARWPHVRRASDRAAVLQLGVLPWFVHGDDHATALPRWFALRELHTRRARGTTTAPHTSASATTTTAAAVDATDVAFVQAMRALCWPCVDDCTSSIVQRALHLDAAKPHGGGDGKKTTTASVVATAAAAASDDDDVVPDMRAWSLSSLVAVLCSSRARQRLAFELLYVYLHALHRDAAAMTTTTAVAATVNDTTVPPPPLQQQRRRSCELLCLYVLDVDRFATTRGIAHDVAAHAMLPSASSSLLQPLDGVRRFAAQQLTWPYALSRLAFAVTAAATATAATTTTTATAVVREMTLYEAWQSTSDARARALVSGLLRCLAPLCYDALTLSSSLCSALPTTPSAEVATTNDGDDDGDTATSARPHGHRARAWRALQPIVDALRRDGGALARLLLCRDLTHALRHVVDAAASATTRDDNDDDAAAAVCEQLLQVGCFAGFVLWLALSTSPASVAATTDATCRGDDAARLCALVTRQYADAVDAWLLLQRRQHQQQQTQHGVVDDACTHDAATAALLARVWPAADDDDTRTRSDNVDGDDSTTAHQQCTQVVYTHVLTRALRTRLVAHNKKNNNGNDNNNSNDNNGSNSNHGRKGGEATHRVVDVDADVYGTTLREWAARLRDEDAAQATTFVVPLTSLYDALWQLVRQRQHDNGGVAAAQTNTGTTTTTTTSSARPLFTAAELAVVVRVLCAAHLRSGCNILGKRSSSLFDTMAAVALAVRAPDDATVTTTTTATAAATQRTNAATTAAVAGHDDDGDRSVDAVVTMHARLRRIEAALHASLQHHLATLPLTALVDAALVDLLSLEQVAHAAQQHGAFAADDDDRNNNDGVARDVSASCVTHVAWCEAWHNALASRPHARLVTGMLLMQYGALLTSSSLPSPRDASEVCRGGDGVTCMPEERMDELQRYADYFAVTHTRNNDDDNDDGAKRQAASLSPRVTLPLPTRLLQLLLRSLVAAEVRCMAAQAAQLSRTTTTTTKDTTTADTDTARDSNDAERQADRHASPDATATLHEHARRMARVHCLVLYIALVYGDGRDGRGGGIVDALHVHALRGRATALQTLYAMLLQSVHDALPALTRGGGEEVLWWFAATLATVQRCWRASTHNNDDDDADDSTAVIDEQQEQHDGSATTTTMHSSSSRMWLTLWDVQSVAQRPATPSRPLPLLAALLSPHDMSTRQPLQEVDTHPSRQQDDDTRTRAQRRHEHTRPPQWRRPHASHGCCVCTRDALPWLCAWSRYLLACLAPFVQSAQLEQQQQQRLQPYALHSSHHHQHHQHYHNRQQQQQQTLSPHVRIARVRGSMYVLAAVHALDDVGVSTTRARVTATAVLQQLWLLCSQREALMARYASVLLHVGACMPCSHVTLANVVWYFVRRRGQLSDAALEHVLRAMCVYVQTCERDAGPTETASMTSMMTIADISGSGSVAHASCRATAASDGDDAGEAHTRAATTHMRDNNSNSNSSSSSATRHVEHDDDKDEADDEAMTSGRGDARTTTTTTATVTTSVSHATRSWSTDVPASVCSSGTLRRAWHDVCKALLDDGDADAVPLSTLVTALHCGALLRCHDTATFEQLVAYVVCGGRAHELSLSQCALVLRACHALPSVYATTATTHAAADDNDDDDNDDYNDDNDDDPLLACVLQRLHACAQTPLHDTASTSVYACGAAFSDWLEALPCVSHASPSSQRRRRLLWRRAHAAVRAWTAAAQCALPPDAASWWAREWWRSYAYARHCAGLPPLQEEQQQQQPSL